jgi:hypothetical protein
MPPLIRTIRFAVAGVALATLIASCGDPTRQRAGSTSVTVSPDPFDGVLRCPAGEEAGAGGWDYGANPRGTVDDPIAWTRENAVGLIAGVELSFVEEIHGSTDELENVVLAKNEDGLVIAFVEFGRDDNGRYLPNYFESCASSGIEEFS